MASSIKINDIYEKINNINVLTINNDTKFDKINRLYNEMSEEEINDFYEKYKDRNFNKIFYHSMSNEEYKKYCVFMEIEHQIDLIKIKQYLLLKINY